MMWAIIKFPWLQVLSCFWVLCAFRNFQSFTFSLLPFPFFKLFLPYDVEGRRAEV